MKEFSLRLWGGYNLTLTMSLTSAILFGCVFGLGIYFLVVGVVKMTTEEMKKYFEK